MDETDFLGMIVRNLVFILFSLFILRSVFYMVKGKTAKILETFGKPHKQASLPGLHVKLPWPITSVVGVLNLQLQEISAEVSVKTSDNAFMLLPVKVQYRASDHPAQAVKAHYELEDPEEQIKSYILNNARQTASSMTMVELYQNRDNIEIAVTEALTEKFSRFGYLIENVLVDEPQPSHEVRDAFNRVIASERDKEAAQNEADAEKIRRIGKAEAEAASKKLQGQGMADMRKAIAHGAREATKELKEAMPELNDQQIAEFLLGITRLDAMTAVGEQGNLVVLDLKDTETSSTMVSTLAALKARENKG